MAKKTQPARKAESQAVARRTKRDEQVTVIRGLLDRARPQIKKALPRWLDPERFARITMTAVQLQPKLLGCEPLSLISAVMQCAQLGLEPDPALGHVHLVPFKDRVQIIVGYRGIMRLARTSDEVAAIEARAVYSNDEFEFDYGDGKNRFLRHRPTEENNAGVLRAAYAICRFKNGGEVWDVTLPRHIEKIRSFARGASRSDSPWVLHPEEMWRKSAVRRLEPFLPLDPIARHAIAVDEAGERGESQYPDLELPFTHLEGEDELEELTRRSEGAASA